MARNRAKLLVDGHQILPALLRDLVAAQQDIHLSVFLFFRDPIGLQVAEVLAQISERSICFTFRSTRTSMRETRGKPAR
jgi:phosphatidylserine/phosphatidylglycerophosphate/cardiolipin synthase-like enzyme